VALAVSLLDGNVITVTTLPGAGPPHRLE